MKSSLLRALLALVAGVLMIVYPDKMAEWLTIAIGVLFILAGVISIVFYAVARRRYDDDVVRDECTNSKKRTLLHKPIAPIVGVGCTVLGFILALMPDTVNAALVYVFAALLIVGALGQFYILITARLLLRDLEKAAGERLPLSCDYVYWVLPILLFLFGLFTIAYPKIVVNGSFLFIGIAMVIYSLSELTSAIKAHSVRRYARRHQPTTVVPLAATDTESARRLEEIEEVVPVEEVEVISEEPSVATNDEVAGGVSNEEDTL